MRGFFYGVAMYVVYDPRNVYAFLFEYPTKDIDKGRTKFIQYCRILGLYSSEEIRTFFANKILRDSIVAGL